MDARSRLTMRAGIRLVYPTALTGLLIFVSAGTWRYPQGWNFLAVLFACSVAITLYLLKTDPKLLERRLAAAPLAEQRTSQKIIQVLILVPFLLAVVVSALDHRLSGSHVPLVFVVLGDALLVVGYLIISLVFRENSFASALVEVVPEQRVIDTGPYARVRHPMYSGAIILWIGIPLSLGSFWGLLTLIPFVAILVWRLLDEEAFLSEQLPGYDAYRRRVRHRLIPGVW